MNETDLAVLPSCFLDLGEGFTLFASRSVDSLLAVDVLLNQDVIDVVLFPSAVLFLNLSILEEHAYVIAICEDVTVLKHRLIVQLPSRLYFDRRPPIDQPSCLWNGFDMAASARPMSIKKHRSREQIPAKADSQIGKCGGTPTAICSVSIPSLQALLIFIAVAPSDRQPTAAIQILFGSSFGFYQFPSHLISETVSNEHPCRICSLCAPELSSDFLMLLAKLLCPSVVDYASYQFKVLLLMVRSPLCCLFA
ncbi:MAG TPA: hypothetical protein V6C97_22740, partial [Oculatellaceae cyanobacterium]